MLEKSFRGYYQKIFINPVVRLIDRRISPTQVTCFACLLGLLFIPAMLYRQVVLAITLLLVSGYCDTLDGSLARHQNKCTPLGTVLDIMADRTVEFSVIFAFYLINPAQHALPAILMLGSILLCVTSFLIVGVFTENSSEKSFHYSPGIMERAEAFLFFILMVLMPHYFVILAYSFTGLVLITASIRLFEFARFQKIE